MCARRLRRSILAPTWGLLGLAGLVVAGCGGGEGGASRGATVDTLPSGRIVTRNPRTGIRDDASRWTVRVAAAIGGGEGTGSSGGSGAGPPPDAFGSVRGLALDGLGRIWIADTQAQAVRVFSADGRFVRTVGGPGEGPGEFLYPNGLARGPAGRMWVVDGKNGRFTVFDTAGRLDTTFRRESFGYGYLWSGSVASGGRVFDPVMARRGDGIRQLLVVRGPDMRPQDTLDLPDFGERPTFEHRDEQRGAVMQVPFTPGTAWRVGPRGHVWASPGSPYRLIELGAGGDTLRVVEKDYDPVPVSAAERDSAEKRVRSFIGKGADLSRIPDAKPALRDFTIDDRGRLWVLPSMTADSAARALDVFDRDGVYLGRVALPGSISFYPPPVIEGDVMLALFVDDLGVQRVERLEIRRGSGAAGGMRGP